MEDLRAEWENLQQVVIGYIFSHGSRAFYIALTRVKEKFFSGKMRSFWKILVEYNKTTMGIPAEKGQFRKFIRAHKASEDMLFQLEELLENYKELAKDVDSSSFTWHLGRLSDVYNHIHFYEVLVSSMDVLNISGFDEARSSVLDGLTNLDSGHIDLAQEGNVFSEGVDVMREITEATSFRKKHTVDLGFRHLDSSLLGLGGGDLVLFVGWVGVGKTCFCVNVAVNVSFLQKKNVIYVTTETIRRPLRRRIFSRLTKLEQFSSLVPVSSRKLKSGELTDAEKETIARVEQFLSSSDVGQLMLVQAPAVATVDWLRGKLLQFENQFRVDLVIVDDLRSLTSNVKGQDFEKITQIVKDLKSVARTHANRGVPLISPHHITRDEYKALRDSSSGERSMSLAGLASSSEAERRSDVVVGMWYDPEVNTFEMRFDFLKVRDGEAGRKAVLGIDWAYQHFFDKDTGVDVL